MDPLVHHLDQATEPATAPCAQPALSIPALHPRDRFPCTPAWVKAGSSRVDLCGRADPAPRGPSRATIEPTRPRPNRRTSHSHDLTRLSHFSCFAQPFWIKRQLVLSFRSVILLYCCYIAQPFFATVLSHFRELSHFHVDTINSTILATTLSHFCYIIQSFCILLQ
jgi:hypothetical protein